MVRCTTKGRTGKGRGCRGERGQNLTTSAEKSDQRPIHRSNQNGAS